MTSRPLDTDARAWAQYTATTDRMGGPARVLAAVELSETVREIRLAGLRARHPRLEPREVTALLISEDYGVDLTAGL